MNSTKLAALSVGLLLCIFCTIGMSFTPTEEGDGSGVGSDSTSVSGPRRSHFVTNDGCSDTYNNKLDYGKVVMTVKDATGGTVSATGTNSNSSTADNNSTSVTVTWNCGYGSTGQKTDLPEKHTNTITFTASRNTGYNFEGWYSDAACTVLLSSELEFTESFKIDHDSYGTEQNKQYESTPQTWYRYAKFVEIVPVDLTFIAPGAGGSYTVKVGTGTATPVTTSNITREDVVETVTLSATPASGYVFAGWYQQDGSGNVTDLSGKNPYEKIVATDMSVGARFVSTSTTPKFKNITTGTEYYGLKAALAAASSGQTIIPVADCVVDGSDLIAGTNDVYTIPSGVTLLIPYSSANTVQTLPYVVTSAATLSAYRKLTLTEGVTIAVNGTLCVGGQVVALSGNHPTGYTTGACGLLDMSAGGHIDVRSGGTLYCWGFIKGQDMEQGNNTEGMGRVTANPGSTIWEAFSVGDWRGGDATSTIANTRFFPFQSYFMQNIEVPTTFWYGSTEKCYFVLNATGGPYDTKFDVIGSENCLFKLQDADSKVRKWYDPTTDLTCFELSGTAILDALKIKITGLPLIGTLDINSEDFDLPITSNMHIILTNCTMTLNKPLTVQPGAVVEIKHDANVTLTTNIYLYDKDDWGPWVLGKYFKATSNLTIHKNRGDGTSNEYLDDAKFIVDGPFTISSGKLYSTAGGADVMGNDGGTITFPSSLASATTLKWYRATTTSGDGETGTVAVNQACLHNEDESYTKAIKSTTFHNVRGRWFTDANKDENTDHTYNFTYIASGAVSGTGGTDVTPNTHNAVYSNDKTGLEARMKWFNVTADACANWWHGQGDQSTWFYNWTLNSAWHQFIPTATEGLYSGSNNTLYTKSDCDWEPFGDADVNCLYEIGGVKKALVDGQFIALEANNNDPAYHAADDANQYYICFAGCNWHAADKYTEEQKAYIIAPDTFIWYNDAWMSVNFKKPFAYTMSETNVPIYYEYLNGEWVLAEPYVRVVDGSENRAYWFFKDAFTFANSVLRTAPTITILRDLSATSTAWSYTATNKNCTLDLNGKKVTLTVTGAGTTAIKMFNINASGTTFTITDNSAGANGELRMIAAPNTATQSKRWHGVYLTDGTLVLNAGKVYAEDNFKYTSTSDAGIVSAVTIAAGKSFTMNGGTIEAYSKYSAIGVNVAGSASANATVKIKGGTIHAETTEVTTAYGMYISGGTTTITGGKIEARTKTTTAIGIATTADASGFYGTLKMEGGEVEALSTTTTAYGIQVGEGIAYSSGNIISNRVLSRATISGGTIRATSTTTKSSSHTVGVRSFGTTDITGGTIECNATQSIAYGVYAVSGTTTVSGSPTIIARAPTYAYGACAGLTPADKTGVPYNGHLEISGGHFDVSATTSTYAYGVLVQALGRAVSYSTKSGYYPGNYVSAGSAIISGGEFDVQAHTTTAYGIFVKGAITQEGAKLDADGNLADPVTSAPPTCTVSGGKFKTSGTGTVLATNNAAEAANYHINGGYYSHDGNLAGYVTSPKHVVTLPEDDANRPDYSYKVADAYLVTFLNKDGTGDPLQATYQEPGKAAVYEAETPTWASTTTESYIFDGWATTANGAKAYDKDATLPNVTSAGATYYAHYETTTLKYIVSFDATTNGGTCDGDDKKYVEPSAAVGTLPTASKTGYTFNGWYTAASDGTKITTATTITADVTYYAQFTVKTYTLTWVLDGGKVSTAGKYGSTSWPAKNATGTQSKAVSYGLTLTAPVVARTGYTFSRWEPTVASTMPAEAATYTAIWTPKTNTAYTVKHYQQNVDGTYPTDPFETEAFTGTTATSVTPAVKSYDGFISPATQTKTIAADGSMVVEYQYARRHYTFTLDAATNGGTTDVPSIDVIHGATIGAVPPDAQKGCNDFLGWFTKPVGGEKITSSFVIEYDMKTLYAQFSNDVRTYPITYLPGANGTGTVDAGTKTCGVDMVLSSSTFTRPGYTQTGWSTTDGGTNAYELDGEYTANAALTLYPFWTLVGYQINFVDEDGTTTLGDYPKTLNPGATVTAPAEPTKAQTAEYTYTFAGWFDGTNTYASDAIPNVTAAATYTATYTATPNVASVKVGSAEPTYYTTIQDAFTVANSAESASTIKMLKDVSGVAASLVYSGTQNCTLDLNNHTIAGTVTKLIDVNASGKTFTIDDSSDDKGGMISLSRSTNGRIYSLYITAGIVKLTHGKIYCKNTSTGSSAGATAIYVTAGQTFTMDDGTVESESQISSYAIYAPAGTSTITINDGLVKGHTNTGATAGGIICYAKGLTINGGRIIGHAWTTTSYGLYLYGGSATLNGGEIEATNDTISNNGTTTAYGIYVRYSSSTYKGVLTIPSTSTVEVLAKARTSTAYAVVVSASSSGSKIQGGTFTATAKTSYTARGISSAGTITISGGTFNVHSATSSTSSSNITRMPLGIYSERGTVTVNGNPTFNVTCDAAKIAGVFAYGTVGKNGKGKYSGTIKINGGTFNVTTTTTTAYGAYAGLFNRTVNLVIPENATDTIAGTHYMPGIISITGGTFNVKATTNTAYGIVVAAQISETIGDVTTDRIPTVTVTGGKFKVTGTSKTYAVNTSATNTALDIQAGWYNINTNLANYTAPTKSCNYWVLPLTGEDPYKYEVAEAYELTFNANGHGTAPDAQVIKKNGTATEPTAPTAEGWTFDGWYKESGCTTAWNFSTDVVTADTTLYAKWTTAETGDYLDIVDWTTTTLTLNANGWTASGWPYTINNVEYQSTDRENDRTLTIPYSGAAGTELDITVKSGETTISKHTYTIPYINTAAADAFVYVSSGTLSIDASSVSHLATLSIRPGASVEVTNGTLTVDSLVLRTEPWQTASISGNVTATKTYYTRIAPNNRTISGLGGDITYISANYYQFALPLNSTVAVKDIKVTNNAKTTYGKAWLIKYYDEASRAETGAGDNWVVLDEDDYIQGGVGYEMSSNSAYYREYLFPVGTVNTASLGTTTTVSYDLGAAGEDHAGWNIVGSPLMSVYDNSSADPETGLKVSLLQTDGSYDQGIQDYIYPAIPFTYQASEGQTQISFASSALVASAPRRRIAAADEPERIQWIHLDVKDATGKGDHTSVLSHPTRYEETYKTGIDVAKQSLTASRATLYTSHSYGEMAFAGVSDALLEQGVALTVYSPKAQELTISMRENAWLNRMAYVWLFDSETGTYTDLLDSDATIEVNAGTTTNRFSIIGRFFAPQITTDLEPTSDSSQKGREVEKLLIHDKLYIRINGVLYDATGKTVNLK